MYAARVPISELIRKKVCRLNTVNLNLRCRYPVSDICSLRAKVAECYYEMLNEFKETTYNIETQSQPSDFVDDIAKMKTLLKRIEQQGKAIIALDKIIEESSIFWKDEM